MKKVVLSFIILSFSVMIATNEALSQNQFVDYKAFEAELKEGTSIEQLSKNYDFLFLSLLDSSYNQLFFEYDSELHDLYSEYSQGLKLSYSTLGFATQITSIRNLFDSKSLIKQFLSCVSGVEVQVLQNVLYPIYVKDNTAIVKVESADSSDIYQLSLQGGVVQVNWLGGIME